MKTLTSTFALAALLLAAACGDPEDTTDEPTGAGSDDLTAGSATKSFVAKGTGYFPDSSAMEGGFVDRKGVKLNTLQQYLAGSAKYVSVAMDLKAFSYGQRLRINELNKKYGKDIVFKVVDTGGAFMGKGTSRIDICTANSKASVDPTINGQLHIDAIDDSAPSVPVGPTTGGPTTPVPTTTPTNSPRPPTTTTPPPSNPDSTAHGNQSCGSDGACNPGNDGAGLICVASRCVPGCHSDAQCPGVTTCSSGQCR